jgi:hypothetical protein
MKIVPVIALCFIICALLLYRVINMGICHFKVVTDAVGANSVQVAECVEFWLNRYQTLLSALLALFAAAVASVLVYRQVKLTQDQLTSVQRQVELAEEQMKVAAGLIAPDFRVTAADS